MNCYIMNNTKVLSCYLMFTLLYGNENWAISSQMKTKQLKYDSTDKCPKENKLLLTFRKRYTFVQIN